jgi:hypothetical protein
MTLCSTSKLPEAVLATMAERLRRELLQPADLAAAATAQLQVGPAVQGTVSAVLQARPLP